MEPSCNSSVLLKPAWAEDHAGQHFTVAKKEGFVVEQGSREPKCRKYSQENMLQSLAILTNLRQNETAFAKLDEAVRGVRRTLCLERTAKMKNSRIDSFFLSVGSQKEQAHDFIDIDADDIA